MLTLVYKNNRSPDLPEGTSVESCQYMIEFTKQTVDYYVPDTVIKEDAPYHTTLVDGIEYDYASVADNIVTCLKGNEVSIYIKADMGLTERFTVTEGINVHVTGHMLYVVYVKGRKILQTIVVPTY